jgi:hypothetical protein
MKPRKTPGDFKFFQNLSPRGPGNLAWLRTSGVQRGKTTNGTDWKFSFLPSAIDGTSTLQDNATVVVTLDGVNVSVNETSGETTSQVASDVYHAMVSAGVTDASLSGSTITFLNDTSGQETLSAGVTITGPSGGSSVNWIEFDLDIAQRTILN